MRLRPSQGRPPSYELPFKPSDDFTAAHLDLGPHHPALVSLLGGVESRGLGAPSSSTGGDPSRHCSNQSLETSSLHKSQGIMIGPMCTRLLYIANGFPPGFDRLHVTQIHLYGERPFSFVWRLSSRKIVANFFWSSALRISTPGDTGTSP